MLGYTTSNIADEKGVMLEHFFYFQFPLNLCKTCIFSSALAMLTDEIKQKSGGSFRRLFGKDTEKMKRFFALLITLVLTVSLFASCGLRDDDKDADGKTVLKVAVLESAYGKKMWEDVAAAYEADHQDIKIELTAEKNLEDVIGSKMKSGDYPDVVHLATGREAGLTETMVRENSLADISDILDEKVFGEEKTVKEKLIDGFTDTAATHPYGDDKMYMAPMFYGPCGLFYNAALFAEKNWSLPTTWDEMWELGQKAEAENIALFTYPTAGYFDALIYALLCETGGVDFYNDCMQYKEGVWDDKDAREALDIVARLASYTEPTTVANANNDNYLKNQQLVLDNKALFMPNGTWVSGEMADAPRVEGFEWGFMALPAIESDKDRYSYTYFEQIWVPENADHKDEAKDFIAYLYSDKAVKIFAESGAIQPIQGISDMLEGENKLFYSIYDTGAKAVMGGFAATDPVEGVSMVDTLFGTVNSIVSGDKTVDEWQEAIGKASDSLRKALKK